MVLFQKISNFLTRLSKIFLIIYKNMIKHEYKRDTLIGCKMFHKSFMLLIWLYEYGSEIKAKTHHEI
jgi:hypothetical protein